MSLSPSADLVRTPPTADPAARSRSTTTASCCSRPASPTASRSVQATRVPFAILNSLVVAVCVTAINLVLGSLAGYAYARATAGAG